MDVWFSSRFVIRKVLLGSFLSRDQGQAVRTRRIAAIGDNFNGESACVEPGFELAVAHGHQVVGLGGACECD